jgi:hypothetical protein
MLWDTTIAATAGYMAALLYNQNNVASMASGVTLQLEREVRLTVTYRVKWQENKNVHNLMRKIFFQIFNRN